ncbi:MAG TPA: DUF1127 domain-containing protein [Ferrovibrio sp.]|jgi:uncharacterized protein YjiS (DUF1127 family)|uniref:DUF1127 domain-containing protein n=1 Tax=Ferrovibrio sp. TaxID=1917215 RepID=UPI002B4AB99A|nr:DUF1127 domain-containing protein [Ferrovibrio sp.]HLT78283.1 DUF1127 domain-containing protein [Ferrovibrio sp.]
MTNCTSTIGRPYEIGPVERAGSTIGRVIDRVVAVSARGATGLVIMLLDWQREVRERAHLASLPNEILKDVGLTRADVEAELSKPLWLR